jgi:hypothetical protein
MKIFSIHQQQIRLGDDLEILFFIDRLVNQDQQERKSDFSINIFLCVQRLFFLRFVFLYVLFAQEKHIHTHTHTTVQFFAPSVFHVHCFVRVVFRFFSSPSSLVVFFFCFACVCIVRWDEMTI